LWRVHIASKGYGSKRNKSSQGRGEGKALTVLKSKRWSAIQRKEEMSQKEKKEKKASFVCLDKGWPKARWELSSSEEGGD